MNAPGTVVYGLVGRPLGHSFSRPYFMEKFAKEGRADHVYLHFELSRPEELLPLVQRPGIRGLNVTSPYKRAVIPLMDTLSEEAAAVQAVNVIRVVHAAHGVRLEGFNTDVIGCRKALEACLVRRREMHPDAPTAREALVLGSGGGASAACRALEQLGVAPHVVSRTSHGEWTYQTLRTGTMGRFQIIVQATPLGMYPDTGRFPPIPYEGILPHTLCFDLVYNPAETAFMKQCARQDAMVSSGLQMLHAQAEAAWQIWNDQNLKSTPSPNVSLVRS